MDVRATKRALRREMVDRISRMDPADRLQQEAALIERFATLPGYASAGTVLLYVAAFPEEIPTRPMLLRALQDNKRLVCPRVDRAERRLRFYAIGAVASDFRPGTLGIPEPDPSRPEVDPLEIDWALVPGLAFDERGYRLGRGAGHYDRLLPRLRPEVQRWALLFEPQWVEALPVEPHDQRLNGAASATRTNSVVLLRSAERTEPHRDDSNPVSPFPP